MAAKKKKPKPTKKQITEELQRTAKEFEHMVDTIWGVMLRNAATRLGIEEEEELEEESGALT